MGCKTVNFSRKIVISFILLAGLIFTGQSNVYAASGNENEDEGGGTDFIMHHIKDGYSWHFFTVGHTHATLYLPVILYSPEKGLDVFLSSNFYNEDHEKVTYNGYKLDHGNIKPVEKGVTVYDLSITKNVFYMFISVALLLIVFLSIAKRYKKHPTAVPRGIQSFFEPLIIFIRDDIAKSTIGEKKYHKFLPYLLSIFFFILFNNLLGLLPAAANVTGNISITFVLAVFTFLVTNLNGNKNYWKHVFATPGVPAWLMPVMVVVEIIGLFTKPFALMVRLFANITAGHIIILSILGLIFIFKSVAVGPISVAFATVMYFLELLVAFIQAYIFTLLSSIYFAGAVEEHHDEAHETA